MGRALRGGWLDELEDRKKQAAETLFDLVENAEDPAIKLEAFQALVRADQADLKREEVAIKKQEADDNRRLQLLEFARSLPAGEVARIASEHQASNPK
jgi:hypothetical protein